MEKILVTGNCGFIGQNFARMFADKYDLVGVDKMDYAADRRALSVIPTFVSDIADAGQMDRIFRMVRPEAVINFAASSHVDRSIQDAQPFITSNILGTHVLLDASVRHGVGRFVQVSTDEIYGDLQIGDAPFKESDPAKPSSPYSASKASADMLALAWHRTHGLDVVITRSCNNYGPYQHPEKFIPVIILNALRHNSIPIYGAGENIREWIYVEDNCLGVMTAFELGVSGAIYNIGSGMELSNLDMAHRILVEMKCPWTLINFVEDRKGHDFRYALDSSAIRSLGWEPKTGILCGMEETIAWFVKNLK